MKNILEYLEATVSRVPEKLAFSDDNGGMTFREVWEQARALGSFLHRRGICGKPVVVYMRKQPKTIAAFLGAVYGGCYYVPLDEQMPRSRVERILNQLDRGLLLCDETTLPLTQGLDWETGCLYDQAITTPIEEQALAQIRERQLDMDPIYVVFTSGSTGVPKGVVGCHRSVLDYIENLCSVLPFDENTVFGNQTPLYFDACLKEILPALKYGGSVHLLPRQLFLFPVRLVEYLNDHRINTLCWVVSALTFVSSFGTFDRVKPKYLRTIAFASEVFPIRQLNLWRAAVPHARFFNLYGPTETTGICCYYEVDRAFDERETLPVGRPFPNTGILLLDENGRIPPPGEQGEICIRGTRLALGYYRDPERTAEAFVQNPLNLLYPERIYRTGDLGRYNERGELVFLSRKDDQIKHMGHRIELGEIEAATTAHEAVTAACSLFDPEKKKLLLYYSGGAAAEELAVFLKEKLPRYMLPNRIHQLPQLPLTPNGKVDRSYLKKQHSSSEGGTYENAFEHPEQPASRR